MAGAATLSEPQVLAHAKRRLFPESDAQGSYVVCDTQFGMREWVAGQRVSDEVRSVLAPFNHVRVGSGYPDLLGVRMLESEFLAVERFGEEPPLIAVEAKGYTESGAVDVERGVVQAYDRLHEANAAFTVAPTPAISESARTLARELNVGMLGVDADGGVAALEVPRVVGNRTSDEASAIRFQATAQGVADKSFSLNHPKNYLAYPLAVVHDRETDDILAERVVGAVDGARTGAAFLGLVAEQPHRVRVTSLGQEVVRFALDEYGSVDAALSVFEDWQGRRERFVDLAPRWGELARRVVWAYPATQLIVSELQTMHEDGTTDPSLVDLVTWLHSHHPAFTVELFVRGTEDARSRVLTEDGDLTRETLRSGAVYHAPTVFPLKAMLYHTGLLAERGAEPSRLDPESDSWRLRTPVPTFR